jgi:hypothetical protein
LILRGSQHAGIFGMTGSRNARAFKRQERETDGIEENVTETVRWLFGDVASTRFEQLLPG